MEQANARACSSVDQAEMGLETSRTAVEDLRQRSGVLDQSILEEEGSVRDATTAVEQLGATGSSEEVSPCMKAFHAINRSGWNN